MNNAVVARAHRAQSSERTVTPRARVTASRRAYSCAPAAPGRGRAPSNLEPAGRGGRPDLGGPTAGDLATR